MSYLIDTNIISELRKGARCDAHVSAWYASIADEDLFLSTLVLGEIRKGIELARPRDAGKAAALEYVRLGFGATFVSTLPGHVVKAPRVVVRDVTSLFARSAFYAIARRDRIEEAAIRDVVERLLGRALTPRAPGSKRT